MRFNTFILKYFTRIKLQALFMIMILMSVFCLHIQNVHASLMNIVVDGGQVSGIPIAIVPFAVEGSHPQDVLDISKVIWSDLQSSGQFSPTPFSSLRERPSTPSQVQYGSWQNLGVEDLVIGRVRKSGSGRYTVNFELMDIVRQSATGPKQPLYAMQFDNIRPEQFRALAHHISDLIFEKLIGVRGIFSTRIAYVSVLEGKKGQRQYSLEIADSDGHNPKILYRSNFVLMSPAWSPDGKKLAFVSYDKERPSINVVDTQNGHIERITQFPGMNNAPAWSPDGRTLAVVLSKDGNPKIYTVDLSSKRISRLTDGTGADTEPCFAPDGRSIVFTSDRGGKPQTYRVSMGGGKIERLTFNGNYNAKPSLTPDGKNLVTLHRGEGGLFSIAVHNLATGTLKVLTQSSLNDSPAIAPNGMMVLYGSLEGGRGVLGAVTLDGRLKIRLPSQEGNVQEPAWSPFPKR